MMGSRLRSRQVVLTLVSLLCLNLLNLSPAVWADGFEVRLSLKNTAELMPSNRPGTLRGFFSYLTANSEDGTFDVTLNCYGWSWQGESIHVTVVDKQSRSVRDMSKVYLVEQKTCREVLADLERDINSQPTSTLIFAPLSNEIRVEHPEKKQAAVLK